MIGVAMPAGQIYHEGCCIKMSDQWSSYLRNKLGQGSSQPGDESQTFRRELLAKLMEQSVPPSSQQNGHPLVATPEPSELDYQKMRDAVAGAEEAFLELERLFLADERAYIETRDSYRESLQVWREAKKLYEQVYGAHMRLLSNPALERGEEAARVKAREDYQQASDLYGRVSEVYMQSWMAYIEARERYKQAMQAYDDVEVNYLETIQMSQAVEERYIAHLERSGSTRTSDQ